MSEPWSDGRKIGVLLSGGLSSLALAAWLHGRGHPVEAFAADLGQARPVEFARFTGAVRAVGIPVHEVDLRRPMARAALETVAYQAGYDGGHWNTTGLSRAVLVEGLVPALRKEGCGVLLTGCVSGGADQRRFERYGRHFAPDLAVVAGWADPAVLAALPTRDAMARYTRRANLPCLPGNTARHSTDGNLAGVSHEDAGLEDLSRPAGAVARHLGVPPQHAPDETRSVLIGIAVGRPVSLDAATMEPEDLLGAANDIAGAHGLGLTDVVENRANGTKCRGVYEAPGLELFGHAVRAAYQATTDRTVAEIAAFLSARLAASVYEGDAYGTAAEAARAGLARIAENVTATVRLDLYKGGVAGRALLDFDRRSGLTQQRRFGGGGHTWNCAPISVRAAAPGVDRA